MQEWLEKLKERIYVLRPSQCEWYSTTTIIIIEDLEPSKAVNEDLEEGHLLTEVSLTGAVGKLYTLSDLAVMKIYEIAEQKESQLPGRLCKIT